MPKAENITKIYDPSHPEIKALDGVSFTLPETGLIFIVGKSGSGKSTLMNLLGGLDAPTTGRILVNGRALSDMSPEEADAYRSEKTAFIFQDFLLADTLTAEENVALSLELNGADDPVAVREALESVGMAEYAKRRPKNLSAGQRQRVAIARALVKKPKMILADEPTGNIDAENTEIVLKLLKKASENALVIVISHSERDAEKYADRVIRLEAGRIVSDLTRDSEYRDELEIKEGDIYLPARPMTAEEIAALNTILKTPGTPVSVSQKRGGFKNTADGIPDGMFGEWKHRKMRPKSFLKHSLKIGKKALFGKLVLALAASIMLAVFITAWFYAAFDPGDMITEYVTKNEGRGVIMRKGYMSGPENFRTFETDRYIAIGAESEEQFESVYGGTYYKLYSVQTSMRDELAAHATENYRAPQSYDIIRLGYPADTGGVLLCDEEYLSALFGGGGEFRLVAGKIATGGGVMITDYTLDAFLFHGAPSAEAVLQINYLGSRVRIDGVIHTGYRERYADVIEAVLNGDFSAVSPERADEFLYEANNYLNILYAVDPGWKEAYIAEYYAGVLNEGFAYFNAVDIFPEGEGEEYFSTDSRCLYYLDRLAPDEAFMDYNVYNMMYGTSYTEATFASASVAGENRRVTVRLEDRLGNVFERSFRITGLYKDAAFVISKEYLNADKAASVQPYALYPTDAAEMASAVEAAEEFLFYPVGDTVKVILEISAVTMLISDLMVYIAVAVAAGIAIILVINAFIAVRSGMFAIGLLRALGKTTGTVGAMFFVQFAFICLLICAIGAAGAAAGLGVAETVIRDNFAEIYPNVVLDDISIAEYDPLAAALACLAAAAACAAAGLIPVAAVRKIKPVKIIRAAE